jgi:enamine deaminase RidA (YjgF/YER057c/UK114 family)
VVRTVIYVTDVADAAAVSKAHAEMFIDVKPASTMVGVTALVAPELLVEIEAYAIIDRDPPDFQD